MTDDDLIKRAAEVLLADYSSEYSNDFDWTEFADQARAVLDALDLPGLLAAAKAEALLDLPVSLIEFVRASGRAQTLIAHDAQITEKHLSRMLNHGEGRIDTWVRVLHAATNRPEKERDQ